MRPPADGDEGGRHQLINASVSNGNLYILKCQVGDKRWFKVRAAFSCPQLLHACGIAGIGNISMLRLVRRVQARVPRARGTHLLSHELGAHRECKQPGALARQ